MVQEWRGLVLLRFLCAGPWQLAHRVNPFPRGMKPFVRTTREDCWTGLTSIRTQVAFVFNNLNGLGYAVNPFGGDDAEYTAQAKALSDTMNKAWINFFVNQDPNVGGSIDDEWPVYDAESGGGLGQNMVFELEGSHAEWDDHRAEGINWFIDNALAVFGS